MFACVGIFGAYGIHVEAFILIGLVPFLLALAAVDLEHFLLPDRLVLICSFCAVSFVAVIFYHSGYELGILYNHLSAGVLLPLILYAIGTLIGKILNKKALGLGDIKLMVPIGLVLGAGAISLFFILSGVLGVFLGLFFKIFKKEKIFPFGPALIAAFYIALLWNS